MANTTDLLKQAHTEFVNAFYEFHSARTQKKNDLLKELEIKLANANYKFELARIEEKYSHE